MGRDFKAIFASFDEWNIFYIPEEKNAKKAQNVFQIFSYILRIDS